MKIIILLSIFVLCSCVQPQKSIDNNIELAIEIGALDQALVLIQERAQKTPNDPALRFQLANIYHQLKRYDMEEIEQGALQKLVIAGSKDQQKLLIEMMKNSLYQGKYQQVFDYFERLQQIDTELSAQLHGSSLMYMAIAHCKQSDYVSCLDYFEQAKIYLPGNNNLVQNIKLAHWMQAYQINQQLSDSTEFYRSYEENKTPQMFSNLVLSLIKEGHEDKAFEVLSTRFSVEESYEVINDLKQIGL